MDNPFDFDSHDIAFDLVPEPSRTRDDQLRSARIAVPHLMSVIHAIDGGSTPAIGRHDKTSKAPHVLPLPDGSAVWMKDKSDDTIEMEIVDHAGSRALSCEVHGKWAKPTATRFRNAAELFLRAAHAAIHPDASRIAIGRIQDSAIHTLARTAHKVSIHADLPWLPGLTIDHPRQSTSKPSANHVKTPFLASLVCADIFEGHYLQISRHLTVVRPEDVSPVEVMRNIASRELECAT